MASRCVVLLAVAVGLIAPAATARTWTIQPDGSGDAPTIQAGVDSAVAGDDVYLAPGIYTWTSQGGVFPAMVRLKPGILLHGSSATTTFLDAESLGRIVYGIDVGTQVRIEDLTIRNGHAPMNVPFKPTSEPQNHEDRLGGGMRFDGNSEPIIRRCRFVSNRAGSNQNGIGGGIYCGFAVIEDCEFLNNRAGTTQGNGGGGAIRCLNARIERCSFRSNGASGHSIAGPGAVYSNGATIADCLFEDNSAGAFQSGSGGAISDAGAIQLQRCTFRRNRGDDYGGALAVSGAATVEQCLFVGNEAFYGGAVYTNHGLATVRDCIFLANHARAGTTPGFCGAINAAGGGLVEGCTLVGNTGGTSQGVGGIGMYATGEVRRCIVVGTVGRVCDGIGTWSCNDLYGNAEGNTICGTDGGDNFSSDPEFCAADPIMSEVVTIQADSPCAPGLHPDGASCALVGAGPVGCGTVGVTPSTWTNVKRRYR